MKISNIEFCKIDNRYPYFLSEIMDYNLSKNESSALRQDEVKAFVSFETIIT